MMLALFLALTFSSIAFISGLVIADALLKARDAWHRLRTEAEQLDLLESALRVSADVETLNMGQDVGGRKVIGAGKMGQRMRPAHPAPCPAPAAPHPIRRHPVLQCAVA